MSEETAVADPETKEAALDAAASKADAADGAGVTVRVCYEASKARARRARIA